jgi:hypothetical protein
MRRGQRAEAVSELQGRLVAAGYPVAVDGAFGPATEAAVRAFQAAAGLEVDGIAGPRTLGALREAVAAGVKGVPAAAVAVLGVALSDVGAREEPPGSNGGPQIAHLVSGAMEYWQWADRSHRPEWCALAVGSWIRIGLGLPPWGTGYAPPLEGHPLSKWWSSARQVEDYARGCGMWRSSPQPGDVFCMARPGGGHVGLVVSVAGVTFATVEGNVSDSVARRVRQVSDVRGFVRWSG